MGNISVLKLVLEAPIQSYGRQSKWDTRDSGYYPSKSAIIGMIGCAMGIERNDEYLDFLADNLSVSVRIDKNGKFMEDLQTVHEPVYTAVGGLKDGGTYHPLLNKVYIQDAIFTVFITGTISLLDKIYNAFQDPVWPVYLGRKSCIPVVPICLNPPYELKENLEEVIIKEPVRNIERLIKNGISELYFQYIIEDVSGNIVSFDSPDSRGQKYYKGRNLKKGVFVKKVKKVDGDYVFE